MKKILGAFSLLSFIVFVNVSAQVRKISGEEYGTIVKNSAAKVKGKSYRVRIEEWITQITFE